MVGCVKERGDTGTEMMVGTQSGGEQVQPEAQESPRAQDGRGAWGQARVQVVGEREPEPHKGVGVAGRPGGRGHQAHAGKTAGPEHTSLRPTLISGAVLNCGGPLSRVPAALASLKLGVGELGGFTGSGTRRLGPPVLFPEHGATPPAPAGAAALGSFLGRREGDRAQRTDWRTW